MITKYKIFEYLNEGEPKIGDWVFINPDIVEPHLQPLVKREPGQIVRMKDYKKAKRYLIQYKKGWQKSCIRENIIVWGDDPDELQNIKNYNL